MESYLLGKEMVYLPAGSDPSWAELTPLGIYLETLDISTVHRTVVLWHKSRYSRVSHHRYKDFWIPERDVASIETSSLESESKQDNTRYKGLESSLVFFIFDKITFGLHQSM